jgi:cytochrome b
MKEERVRAGQPVRVWDAPTRLFHWALVVLILMQFLTGKFDLLDMDWHFRFGYATLALVVFRVLWGLFGSQTSRFSEFVRGPSAVVAYLRALPSAHVQDRAGHNPLGGWSVLALLSSVAVQALSGLFASDDLDNAGPLAAHVSERTVRLMTRVHNWNENLLLGLIAVHVAAIVLYLLLRRDNLIAPMLGGRKRLAEAVPLRFASTWRALVLLLISTAAVAALVWAAG